MFLTWKDIHDIVYGKWGTEQPQSGQISKPLSVLISDAAEWVRGQVMKNLIQVSC